MLAFLKREVQERVVIHVKCWRVCARAQRPGQFAPHKSAGDIFLFLPDISRQDPRVTLG